MEKKIPRYRQIADAIIEKIGRGDYKVGETLPTEEEFCAAYGASRNTVREALRQALDIGLIDRRRRSGTRVISRTPARSLPEHSGVLSNWTQHGPRIPLTVDSISLEPLPGHLSPEETGSRRRWLRVVGRWHPQAIPEPIGMTEIFVHPDHRHVQDLPDFRHRIFYSPIDIEHGHLVRLVRHELEPTVLDTQKAMLLAAPWGMPALLVQRRYYDEKERLIELAINHFPSGRYSYSVSYWRGAPLRPEEPATP
ncbi:GntR family transcriptional regulator [Allostella sp. ATCC 35155]|nr:GntR family transcriptional regulator [Stella sp. ATCC 35155]